MRDFQVGFAKKDITPDLGTLLFGYPYDRPAKRVMDKLSAGAIVMRQDEKTLVIVGVELCSLSVETTDLIRAAISETVDVTKEGVVVYATHTHSGPITSTTAGWGDANDSYLTEILIPRAVEAAKEAFANKKQAEMAVGTVQSHAGMNRRQITDDGRVILGQNPDGPYDPTMTVVRFQTPDGAPIGSFVHYGAHPTTAGGNRAITRDWPGVVVDQMEAFTGAYCLYMNGAEGDVGPRLSNGETCGDDDSAIFEMGNAASIDALKAYKAAVAFTVPELTVFTGSIFLPYSQPPTLEETKAQIADLEKRDKLYDVQITKYAQLQRIEKMLENGDSFEEGLQYEQTMIALGDFAIVPGPFETFCDIALAIKAGSPYAKTIYLGLANGSYGYLPTVEQLPYGGYEVNSFYAAGVTGFEEHASEVFIEGNVRLLKEMHSL